MVDVNVAAGAIGTPLVTLPASAVQVVNFAEDLATVEVIAAPAPAADIWWTCDGSTPAAGVGYYIPAGSVAADSRQPVSGGVTVVKLFSTGTPVVRVQRG